MQASTHTDTDNEVACAQVRLVYRNAVLGTTVTAATASLLVWLQTQGAPHGSAFAWLLYMLGISILRLALAILFRQQAQLPGQAALWRNAFILGVILAGAGWATTVFIFMPAGDIVRQSATALVLGGMAAGAVPILSALLNAYYLFIALTLVPASMHFFLAGDALSGVLGLMILIMVFGLLQSARYLNQTLLEILILSAERARLAASLEQASALIAQQNKQLTTEIEVRRSAEIELLAAKDVAEAANKAKGEFLANMNHEVRTPLSAIIGMTEITLDTELTADQRHYLEVIDRSSRSMLDILNDIRDSSRIDSGRLRLESIAFDLRRLLDELAIDLRKEAQGKNLSLRLEIAPAVPSQVLGDPGRLRQVLGIIGGNAVKFTDAGEVLLAVDADHEGAHGRQLRFKVRDTGIGIGKHQHGLVFKPFSQADATTTRRFGGIGLGLSIAHKLVALMGGTLSFESEEGKGSEFRFALELVPAKPPESVDASSALTHSGRVLLVDDDPDSQELVKFFLENAGYSLCVAKTGKEALEQINASRFDVILLDLHMPGMDGFETARAIREIELRRDHGRSGEEERPGRTPILGLTANTMEDTRERCLQSGMDDYLSKPVPRARLIAAIGQWVPDQRDREEEPV